MKNLAKNAGLLFIALGALCVTSCTKDDVNQPLKPKAVETASLTVPLKVEGGNPTGKNVDRGALPVTIDGINVTAASTMFTWTKSTMFNLFPEGTVGNEHSFILDNVAIGTNNVTAISTTDATPSLTTEVNPGADANNIMAKLRSNKPYAIYTGSGTANVIQGNPNQNTVSPITLTTKHGRNIAVFKLSEELQQLGVTAVVSSKVTPQGGQAFASMTIKGGDIADIYWNNSENDAKIFFAVTLYDAHGVILPSTSQITPPSSFGWSLVNLPANSTNCIYTIKQGALVPVSVTEVFSAQWTDNDPTNGNIGND